jgi:VIT1/CCC1 family predicted Fe2+/Mn2+ transporter
MTTRLQESDYLRNFVFGVEDSLVSTVGLVSGIAIVGVPKSTILLTGLILVFVEAFSMCIGSLLSDNSAREFRKGMAVPLASSLISAVIMFTSYLLSGFLVLLPYGFWSTEIALPVSVAVSCMALFTLGLLSARLTRTSPLRKGFLMMLVGGIAIATGMAVGLFVQK